MTEAAAVSGARAGVSRRVWRLVMLAALVHGLAYLVLLPPWMGEDEPWHVEYAGHVGQGHLPWGGEEMRFGDRELMSLSQLQVRRKVEGLEAEEILRTQWALLDSMREHDFWARVDWAAWPGGAQSLDQVVEAHTAAHQPPLYYLLGGALLYVAGATDVEARMWLLRILSLVAYVAVVAATFALAERTCRDPWVAVACALLVAWWPMHARQAGVANNDVLVKVLTSWTLLVAVDLAREGITARRMVKALALCAAALATKTTGAAALAPVALACAWRGGRRATGWSARHRTLLVGATLAVAAAGVALWAGTDNPAVPRTMENVRMRLETAASPEFRWEFARTFVGAFNWYARDLPSSVAGALGAVGALAGLGLCAVLVRGREGVDRRTLAFCIVTVVAQAALVVLRGVAAGRYLMPALPALAVLACAGLLGPLPERRRPLAVALLGGGLLVFDGLVLWAGLVWNQYALWGA
ncbi:MAG: DUF2142 domain-containing protein [Planctomycetota bacterium]|nr:DUF2142 domain-containing protein [Planctomycetota bacterium]